MNNSEHNQSETLDNNIEENLITPQEETLDSTDIKNMVVDNETVIKELNNQIIRISADLANYRKQSDIDIINAKKQAKKQIVKDIIPFLTTLNLSFNFIPQNEETITFVETIKRSVEKLKTDLEGNKVEIITPNIGDDFDPEYMQALNSPEGDENTIKAVVSVGCKIDGQVISPANILL